MFKVSIILVKVSDHKGVFLELPVQTEVEWKVFDLVWVYFLVFLKWFDLWGFTLCWLMLKLEPVFIPD